MPAGESGNFLIVAGVDVKLDGSAGGSGRVYARARIRMVRGNQQLAAVQDYVRHNAQGTNDFNEATNEGLFSLSCVAETQANDVIVLEGRVVAQSQTSTTGNWKAGQYVTYLQLFGAR